MNHEGTGVKPRFSPREIDLHLARVCIGEARAARVAGFHNKAVVFQQWAANARRRAVANVPPRPAQGNLFPLDETPARV